MNFKDIEFVFGKAFNRTILMLFKPFSFKKWFLLGFIAFLAGALASGGFSLPTGPVGPVGPGDPVDLKSSQTSHSSQPFKGSQSRSSSLSGDPFDQGSQGGQGDSQSLEEFINQVSQQAKGEDLGSSDLSSANSPNSGDTSGSSGSSDSGVSDGASSDPVLPIIFGMMAVAFIIAIVLMLLFSWVSSRFYFIFVNSVSQNTTAIKVPWAEYRREGNSFFKLNLLFFASGLVFLIAMGCAVFFSIDFALASESSNIFTAPGAINWSLLFGGLIMVAVLWLIVFLFYHYISQFVIPIMAKDRVGVREGLSSFFSLLRSRPLAFLLYLPLAVGLGIVGGIFTMVLMFIFLLILLLLGLLLVLIPGVILGTTTVFFVYLFIVFLVFAVLTVIFSFIAGAPVAVFYRAFTLAYLERIAPQYTFYDYDDLAVSEGSNSLNPPDLPPQVS